jgi:hypothetical protein
MVCRALVKDAIVVAHDVPNHHECAQSDDSHMLGGIAAGLICFLNWTI